MLTILSALYNQHFANPQYNICLLGIECSGKTVVRMMTQKFANQVKQIADPDYQCSSTGYRPTVGLNVIKCRTAKGELCLWDLGGKKGLRKIWEHYYLECHGLLFFVDERSQEGFNCLLNVLFHPDMLSIPVVIIASTEEVKAKLLKDLSEAEPAQAMSRKLTVQLAIPNVESAQGKIKVRQMLNWLYESIHELRQLMKAN